MTRQNDQYWKPKLQCDNMPNRMTRKEIFVTFYLLLLMMVSLTTTIGCKGSDASGYRKFTVSEGLASFSFEYPAFYLEPIIDRTCEPDYTLVKSVGTTVHVQKGVESLDIFVLPVSDSFPNSLAMLDFELEKQWKTFADFRLLERTPITVYGGRGEFITFSYSGNVLEGLDIYTGEVATAYIAYFDGGGLIWKIQLMVDEYAVKQAKVHFAHMLQTFRILE